MEEVLVTGFGNTSKQAERNASIQAFDLLREKFGLHEVGDQ